MDRTKKCGHCIYEEVGALIIDITCMFLGDLWGVRQREQPCMILMETINFRMDVISLI